MLYNCMNRSNVVWYLYQQGGMKWEYFYGKWVGIGWNYGDRWGWGGNEICEMGGICVCNSSSSLVACSLLVTQVRANKWIDEIRRQHCVFWNRAAEWRTARTHSAWVWSASSTCRDVVTPASWPPTSHAAVPATGADAATVTIQFLSLCVTRSLDDDVVSACIHRHEEVNRSCRFVSSSMCVSASSVSM